MTGHIRPNSLRALQNISVNGASNAEELNKLDPDNGDHKHLIKVLTNQKFLVSDIDTRLKGEPTRYSLTHKGRSAVSGQKPARHSKGRKQRTSPAYGSVAGPSRHCATSTNGHYEPKKDMLAPSARVGAEAFLAIPSRYGDRLHYRDGSVSDLEVLAA